MESGSLSLSSIQEVVSLSTLTAYIQQLRAFLPSTITSTTSTSTSTTSTSVKQEEREKEGKGERGRVGSSHSSPGHAHRPLLLSHDRSVTAGWDEMNMKVRD